MPVLRCSKEFSWSALGAKVRLSESVGKFQNCFSQLSSLKQANVWGVILIIQRTYILVFSKHFKAAYVRG